MPITANGQTYSDDQIKNFFASAPTNDAIAKQASALGLTADQVSQAAQIAGKNWTTGDVTSWAGSNGYNFVGVNGAAQVSTPQNNGGINVGGKYYSPQQIKDFYAGGGDDNQFAQMAGVADPWQRRDLILQARQIGGASNYSGDAALQTYFNRYKQYNPNGKYVNDFQSWVNDQAPHTLAAMKSGTYTGVPSTPKDYDFGGIYGPGTGHDTSFEQGRYGTGAHGSGDGWGAWTGAAGENAPGSIGIINGAISATGTTPTSSGPTGVINSAQSTGSSGGTTVSGSTQPGTWTVDSNQLVRDQFGNLIDPNSPLMQKARTQALERMGERGLINSSLATTAADSAMYDAALGIAKQDASTYADAAKTNAGAKTSWAIAQNNNATSMANNAASIAAQKELTQAKQLYNNLANQTASATTIQTWGLNTISSIMASDLSADAKNAAIAQIKTWMSDSYSIQGDWHTSAAKAIDAIFGG